MPNIKSILDVITTQIQGVTANLSVSASPISVIVAPGWPSETYVQSVPRTFPPLVIISVYDRGAKNTSRWIPFNTNETIVIPGIAGTLSNSSIAVSGIQTLTLSGTVLANDAVAFIANNQHLSNAAVVSAASSASTLTTMASALTLAINANTGLSGYVSASFPGSGGIITLTNTASVIDFIFANVGNNGTLIQEVARRSREIQVTAWCPSELVREIVGDPIDVLFAQYHTTFGVQFTDGTFGRITYTGDKYSEDDISKDIYRRDFLINAEYGVQQTLTEYSILADFAVQSVTNVIDNTSVSFNIPVTTYQTG